MPRRAGPWYRKERAMWFATINGVQVALDVSGPENREQAVAALTLVLEAQARAAGLPPPPSPSVPRTVTELVHDFLARKKLKVTPGTFEQYHTALRVHLIPAFGTRTVTTLTADEVEDWADRPHWSSSTRNNNLGTVRAFLRWAKHPLDIKRPPKESRGAGAVISAEEWSRVLAFVDRGRYGSDFKALLMALWETGARPSELTTLTVEAVDWVNQCARLKKHKTQRHGAQRVLHFNSAAMAVLEGQRARHKKGLLFRTSRGNPWERNVVTKRCRFMRQRCGVPQLSAYGLRHTFATRALCAGVSDTVVASLLGHRGTVMLHKHYSHLGDQARVLKDALDRLGRPPAA